MDEFEKYVKLNKSEFDEHKADTSKIWNVISSELDKPKARIIPLWHSQMFKVAASVVILLGIFTIVNLNLGINKNPDNTSASIELQEIDMYYQNMVKAQVKLVENNANISTSNKEDFLEFIYELDEEYKTLKLDLSDNLDNERVLEAIINNYKKRIELIENLLQQINDSKKDTDDNTYIL